MGLNVAVVESSYRTRNHYLVVSFVKALKRHPEVTCVTLLDLPRALRISDQKHYDILIAFGGEQADNVVISELRRRSTLSVVWYLEDPYEHDRNLESCNDFDIVITNDQSCTAKYGLDAHHLPLAAEQRHTLTRRPFAHRRYDISFVGTLWPNRARFFVGAQPALAPFKTKIEVTDNDYIRPALAGIQFPYAIGSGVDYHDFMKISEESRLGLMIDRDFSGSKKSSVSDTPGPRFFEVGAVGGGLLVDTRTCGDLAALGFVNGEDYLGFSDEAEFGLLLERFASKPQQFEDIGRSLQAKIAAGHTFDHRADAIIALARAKLAAQVPHGPKPVGKHARAPRILAIAHNLSQFGTFGGGELYLEYLVRHTPQFQWSVLSHDAQAYGTHYVLSDGELRIQADLTPQLRYSDLMLRHQELENFFLKICLNFKPDAIVVNHLHGFPPTLPLIAASLNIPYLLVLHDYYLSCDQFNLLLPNEVHCDVTRPDSDLCNLCSYKRRSLETDSQARRRAVYALVVSRADAIVTNLLSVAERTARVLGVSPACVEVIQPPRLHPLSQQRPAVGDLELHNVALIGSLQPHKGSHDFIEIANALKMSGVRFHVFGPCDQSVARGVADGTLPNVVLHGAFHPGEIPAKLRVCEAALFLSRWPETFCMSLTEALDLAIVPLVYAIGAFVERVTDEIGFLVDPSPRAMIAIIEQLLRDPAPLRRRAAALRARPAEPDMFLDRYSVVLAAATARTAGDHLPSPTNTNMFELGLDWIPEFWPTGHSTVPQTRTRTGRQILRSGLRYLRQHGWRSALAKTLKWIRA